MQKTTSPDEASYNSSVAVVVCSIIFAAWIINGIAA
jgi:hypothetical protein